MGQQSEDSTSHLKNHLCIYAETRNAHKNVPCSQQAWFGFFWGVGAGWGQLLVANELFPLLKLPLGWYISVCAQASQSTIHHRANAHSFQRAMGAQSPCPPCPGPGGDLLLPGPQSLSLPPRKISQVAEAARPGVGSRPSLPRGLALPAHCPEAPGQ